MPKLEAFFVAMFQSNFATSNDCKKIQNKICEV
jgi:hypothetical protein